MAMAVVVVILWCGVELAASWTNFDVFDTQEFQTTWNAGYDAHCITFAVFLRPGRLQWLLGDGEEKECMQGEILRNTLSIMRKKDRRIKI
jgi:hypothetical protein